MAETLTASKIVTRCSDLASNWKDRNDKFKEWYELLLQVDTLKEEDMESMATNEPRTFFNLGLHLLNEPMHHRISNEGLSPSDIMATTQIEDYLENRWTRINRLYRRRGKQSFYFTLLRFILAFGWYAVLAIATQDELIAECWNPAQVYPEFSDDGVVQVAHIYPISAAAYKMKAAKMGWKEPRGSLRGELQLNDLWFLDDNGDVSNAIVVGSEIVKVPESEPFESIPVLVSPVAGLPDVEGAVGGKKDAVGHMGEGLLATNESIYKTYNKHWTFGLQLLRDTAQARWFEQSSSGDILRPEDLFKRGAIFRGGPQDNITPLPVPPIPVEMRTDKFDIQQMIQRGSLPWALWGNIQGTMSAYVMSQISSAAKTILQPYHTAAKELIEDIDNDRWLKPMLEHGYSPYEFKVPKISVPYEVEVSFEIRIPGDFVQRATTARMVDPEFRISTGTTMDMLFPEIKNPQREIAKTKMDDALRHPVAVAVDLVRALRIEANTLRALKDHDGAALYDKAAAKVESMIEQEEEQAPPGGRGGGPITGRPEVTGQPHGVPVETEGV